MKSLRISGAAAALLLVLAVSSHAATAAPAATSDLAAYADKVLSEAYPADQPGAAAIVIQDGKVVLRKGYGMANLELGVPVSPDMVFELGSITKQFTAAAILLLQERGQLRVEDDITKYLADYPTHGETVTIEHLLTHTSGIPSYTGLPEWRPRVREDMKLQDLIALFKDKPFEFKPGEKWAYDNSGYILLGAIIEKVSGKTYEQFIEEEIFDKLGMKSSRYGHADEIIPRRATGYSKDDKGFRNAEYLSMTQPYAAGSLMSTVDDLAIWERALSSEALLKKSSLDRMFTSYKLKSGLKTQYGHGMGVSDFEGYRLLEHSGGIFGFLTDMGRIPEKGLMVAILSNNDSPETPPEALVRRILAKAIGKPIEDRKTVQLDARTLDEYVGVYRFDEQTTRAITRGGRDGAQLFSQRSGGEKQELLATARDDFFFKNGGSRLHFRRDAQGKVTGADFTPGSGPEETGSKTNEPLPQERQPVKLDPAVYDAYVGEYELAPNFSITITREGDQIFAKPTGQPKIEIFPESETRFFLKVVDAQLEFVRGADGKATGLVLHQGGRDMPGKRK
ncbi:MAG TPA: serine hydrolase [Thermoanaerobaculia bacterium]|jgi:CubicO group peptidase (beta-lactamase class C family)|nr:serine hydrolase [Thermoanaerobaculia bacterium]